MRNGNERYKEAAISIARQLCRDSIWHGEACNWLSVCRDAEDDRLFYTRSCGPFFYEGMAGIAYFLAKITALTNDTFIKKTSKGALQQIINKGQAGSIGFYTGLTGIAFVMKQAALLLNEKTYDDFSEACLQKIMQMNPGECKLDAVEGIAGAIPFLIQLQKKNRYHHMYDFIVSMADYLLGEKKDNEHGWSWTTLPGITNDLTGFGHGASGIAHAFACMFEYTGEEKYAEAVDKAFAYENHFFNAEQNNWPDFRAGFSANERAVCSMAWCHGAPGIGMARLYAGKVFSNQRFFNDAQKAMAATTRYNNVEVLGNLSLCHGLAGNTEFIMEAYFAMRQDSLLNQVVRAADCIVNDFIAKRLPLTGGVGNGSEIPGFITGKAGIGYFLLRLYNPALFPSVLLPAISGAEPDLTMF